MTFDNLEKSFKKLNAEKNIIDSWKKPTKQGNQNSFEEIVSKKPEHYYSFIYNLIKKDDILIDYILSGIEGLQKGNYKQKSIEKLCVKILNNRKNELNEHHLYPFLRILNHVVVNNSTLDKIILDFAIEIIYNYSDRKIEENNSDKDFEMQAIRGGINSIRGMAVEIIVGCSSSYQFKDEIFNILEFVADNANEVTRSCVIYNGAWLNNLDKQRAFDLYLRIVKDLNPYLLAIPYCDWHPLLYHMNIDFKRLIPFFEKAITIQEAGKAMAFFLLNAYLNKKSKSYSLLVKLLNINAEARKEIIWVICKVILKDKRYSKKGWRILNYLLSFKDKELGEKFEHSFLIFPKYIDTQFELFINKYLKSEVSKYKETHFYEMLRELIPINPQLILTWFLKSKPETLKKDFYNKSPLNVLIEAYNGICEFRKGDIILEEAMDMFDFLLQIPEYGNFHLRGFLKELSE